MDGVHGVFLSERMLLRVTEMLTREAGAARLCLARALRVSVLAATLALAACASSEPPAAPTGAPDPALLGHSDWCNTNPPSGYCGIDDLR
jgi:hypothetical protein